MKILEEIFEWIVLGIAILFWVLPEIAYSCVLRARDKIDDLISEL